VSWAAAGQTRVVRASSGSALGAFTNSDCAPALRCPVGVVARWRVLRLMRERRPSPKARRPTNLTAPTSAGAACGGRRSHCSEHSFALTRSPESVALASRSYSSGSRHNPNRSYYRIAPLAVGAPVKISAAIWSRPVRCSARVNPSMHRPIIVGGAFGFRTPFLAAALEARKGVASERGEPVSRVWHGPKRPAGACLRIYR